MGIPGDVLLSLFGVLVVVFAPLEVALLVLVGFWLLVPGLLSVPVLPHIVLANRLVLYAMAARMMFSGRPGEARGRAFALTPVHAALALVLVAWFFTGVVIAPLSNSLAGDLHQWMLALDMAVLFVVVLAVARTIGPLKVAGTIGAVLAVSVALAYWERITGHGWGHFFFEHLPTRYVEPGAQPLQARGGSQRVTVNAQFALEYGWIVASLLPLLVVAAVRWSRARITRAPWLPRLAALVPLAAGVVIVFSGSRSAEVAGVAGLAVLVLLAGANRRLLVWASVAAVLAVGVLAVHPGFFTAPFSNGAGDSIDVRLNRIPLLFSFVAGHPFTGGGLSFPPFGIDNGFVTVFATVGMIGLVVWLSLYLAAVHGAARGLRARRGSDTRLLAAACVVGVVELAVACATYDLVSTPESRWALVVVSALGIATAETVSRPLRRRRAWAWRSVLPVAGAFAGLLALATAPSNAAETLNYDTVVAWVNAYSGARTSDYASQVLGETACPLMTAPDVVVPGTEIHCLWAPVLYPLGDPTRIIVLVRGPTPGAVAREVSRAQAAVARGVYLRGGPTGPVTTGKPALAVTAPLIGASAGLMLALLVPPWPWVAAGVARRRARVGAPPAAARAGG